MRIGIVTQPLEMNYGGILQNWALQQVLKNLGHEPITIDAYQRYSTPHITVNYLQALVGRLIGKKVDFPKRYKGALRNELTGKFIEENITKTKVMWDYKRSVVKRYRLDALLVGSDQVWRVKYNARHIEDMYLRFVGGLPLRRVAYAASFGVDEWEYTPEQTSACAPLAQQFDAISVRESSGSRLCREYLGVDAQQVLDPTLLIDADCYEKIIEPNWNVGQPYLAVYCLDINPQKQAFFNRIASERGLETRFFSAGWGARLTVNQWLAMLKNATMVLTDSFHGTVFSILFGKDFYTFCNPQRGNTRIIGLLKQLGLGHRQLSDTEPIEPHEQTINWQDVRSRLDERRNDSLAFLKKNLN